MPEIVNNRLDGWKAIAHYLGKDVSTVMRWAENRGMPVRRVPGGRGGTIYAYAEELDAWLQGQRVEPFADATEVNTRPRRVRRLGRVLVWTLPLVLLASTAAAWILARGRPRIAVRITFADGKLLAWDDHDRLTWTHEFPQPARGLSEADIEWRPWLPRSPFLLDLDGDGRREVIVIAVMPSGGRFPREVLHCFSGDGRLLWHYEPGQTLRFAGRSFTGPWRFSNVLVPRQKDNVLWLAVTHDTWWPSFLATLDRHGRATIRFVSSGQIYALERVANENGRYILAGGVNNEYAAAALAVLDENGPAAASPQSPDSPFRCDDCPAGRPWRYYLLPRSELNRISHHPYNQLKAIRVGDLVQVETVESWLQPGGIAFYELSNALEFTLVSMSDSYQTLHERAERENKIKHGLNDCPERTRGLTVRQWAPESGWTELRVPAPGM